MPDLSLLPMLCSGFTLSLCAESAARDRLGRDAGVERGKKDRSVPLQSVLERMRARKAAALAR